jgi:hypothetical protein
VWWSERVLVEGGFGNDVVGGIDVNLGFFIGGWGCRVGGGGGGGRVRWFGDVGC